MRQFWPFQNWRNKITDYSNNLWNSAAYEMPDDCLGYFFPRTYSVNLLLTL